ncbi:MAG: L,D-transpeptidase [Desulfitobacterium sp.]
MNPIPQRKIIIRRSSRQLELYDGNQLLASYPCAVGKNATPTPIGSYAVATKIMNPGGAFGSRWLGLSLPDYGIHGTNKPSSIGTQASLGCIRMHNQHVEALYNQVGVGTPVVITE